MSWRIDMGAGWHVTHLPCSLNDVISFEDGGKVCCGRVEAINYRETNRPESEEWYTGNIIRVVFLSGHTMEFNLDDYRKKWFLSEEDLIGYLKDNNGKEDR